MPFINASEIKDAALEAYDEMMVECVNKAMRFAPLATSVWSDVLRELDRRGKVKLLSGSYDDVGNAHIIRLRL